MSLNMSVLDIAVMMSEGNPGGLTVICKLLEHNPDGLMYLLHLDDMNIRGTQIWIAFKNYCNQDINYFIECIKARNKDMIAKVNEVNMEQGESWRAVPHGASSGNRARF